MGSPPLARGIPLKISAMTRASGITPACAGNTNAVELHRIYLWDHPRLRGEYTGVPVALCIALGSPPLARGILFPIKKTSSYTRITPACAGNTFHYNFFQYLCKDHPRLRGEYLRGHGYILEQGGSPPLARGIPFSPVICYNSTRITPACAGNTYHIIDFLSIVWDHPRLRGEY